MKKFLFLAMAIMFSLLLTACGASDDKAKDEGTTDSGEAATGGDLIIANISDAVSLNPQGSNDNPSSNVTANIYDTLLTLDENSELQPSLATEWNLVEDTVWEFKLRDDVTFHDGSAFNAEVVKANLDRILDPEVASPRSFLYDMIEEVEVVDEYTVRIKTQFPFSPLPSHLAHDGGGMISKEVIEADYEAMANGEEAGSYINNNPVGTGQFIFEEWVPGQYIKLVRNDNYWGEVSKLDSITFKVVPEPSTQIAELETGNSHIIYPVGPNNVARIENADGIYLDRVDSLSLSYIGFNMDKEPFNDKRVRQALSMAIDKDVIINGVLDGIGTPANGPLAPGVFGYSEGVKPLEYNVEKAKELLAEAGYPDGFSTTLWTNDNKERMDMAEVVQQQLKEIGVDVSIEVVEWGAYLQGTAAGEHDMFILGWGTVTADADYGMYPLFHSANVGEAGNRTFIRSDELDAILEAARQESDQDKRLELYKQAQEILVEEAPMIYIHHKEDLAGVSDKVEGFWQHPNGIFQLKNVSLKQ